VDSVLQEGPRVLDVGPNSLSNLRWTVAPGSTLTVLTVDDRDRPLAGVDFVVIYPRWIATSPGLTMPARSDNEGRYEFSGYLYPGTYEIRSSWSLEVDPVRVDLRAGDGPVAAKLKFPASGSIVVSVRTRGGDVVDGLSVTAVLAPSRQGAAAGAPLSASTQASMNMFIGSALGEGRYRIAPLKPGQYDVRVDDRVNGSVRVPVTVAAGEAAQASIEIDRSGHIRGHVVDDEGVPVPDVWVTARAMGDHRGDSPFPGNPFGDETRVLTDSDGLFALDRLTGGDTAYTLRADQPTGSSAVKGEVKAGEAEIVIRLRAAGTVAGTVVGACGGSTAPVTVIAQSVETGQTNSQQLPAPASPFRLSATPGHLELIAFCGNGQGSVRMTVELAPRENLAGLRLVLEASPLAHQSALAAPLDR
jgi:protocatechuate 3,4-dioxygenase beta subunit